jgi:hypothetical protein
MELENLSAVSFCFRGLTPDDQRLAQWHSNRFIKPSPVVFELIYHQVTSCRVTLISDSPAPHDASSREHYQRQCYSWLHTFVEDSR